nr:hypothetical protein [Tanacetum cinerariifolium]
VTRSYGCEDRPPLHHVPIGCEGCFANRVKGKRKPNLGGRAAGRQHTRDKTRNLSLKENTDKNGPVLIRFEEELRRLEATRTYNDDEINRLARNGKQRWHIPGVSREELRRLEATRTYTDDEINRLARNGKQRWHIPGVSRFESAGASRSGGSGMCGDDEESADDQEDEDEDGDGDS